MLARAQPGGRAQHRRDPGRARRGGGAARAGRARGARRRRRRRRRGRDLRRGAGAAASRACGGSRCGRSPSAPPGAQVALGRARAAEIVRLAGTPEGGDGRARRRPASPSASPGFVRFARGAESTPRPEPVAPAAPRAGADRRLGGARRASPRARSSPPARSSRRSTPRRSTGAIEVRTWREGDRIRPLGMSGTKTLRTCSPTAACRARCAARCRSSRSTARSPGSPASPSRRTSASTRGAERVAVLTARVAGY